MDENQPTEPLYPQQQVPPQPGHPYGAQPPQYGTPARPAGEPFYKRHGLAFAISTLVLGVIVLFGIAGAGAFAVGSVVFHAGSPVSRLLHDGGRGPAQVKPGAPRFPGQKGMGNGSGQGGRHDEGPIAKGVVSGTVTQIAGSTWTITTQRGVTLTVDTSSSTAYGAPGQTQKASDFAVGDQVIVVGTRSGSTVTAIRILNVADLPLRPGQSSPTPTPKPSS
ncbi:hypothetical protein [Streptomyces sp. L7]